MGRFDRPSASALTKVAAKPRMLLEILHENSQVALPKKIELPRYPDLFDTRKDQVLFDAARQ